MNNSGFYKTTIPLEVNLFEELSNSVEFEEIAKGRIGNHLVLFEDKAVPIVRTTTKYNVPAQPFSAIHHMLVKSINNAVTKDNSNNIPAQYFNNALIEIYDANYSKMNYHSDQSLDLDNDSYIGLFSCYEQPEKLSEQNLRKLKIKDKVSNEEFEISLTHNSIILFSLATNKIFLHKIVLDLIPGIKPLPPDNKWLGITFRQSKTYIHFKDNLPYFENGEPLGFANKEQEAEFFKLRGEENRNSNFIYPNLTYTLSLGDTKIPKSSN